MVPPSDPPPMPPHARLMAVGNAFMQTQALHAVASLGVADALAGGPLPLADLAAAVGAKPGHLKRVLRLLVLVGIFHEPDPGVYANNNASEPLQKARAGSLRDIIMHLGDESYSGWQKLAESMLPGQPDTSFTITAGGLNYWEWLEKPENVEAEARFNRAMTAYSTTCLPSILQEYNWSQHAGATVADVGGGVGGVLSALLHKHPGMKGILFDRPQVIEEAEAEWPRLHPDLEGRAQLVGGDFFVEAPAANVVFMKHILHDWNDDDSIKILRTLRRSAPEGSHLLLCENAVPDDRSWHVATASMDLQMMAMAGGKERTVGEWRDLLAAGGYRLDNVVPLSCGLSMVVGRPA